MELTGERELDGVSTDDAWVAFTDPETMARAIPGCKSFESARGADSVVGSDSKPGDETRATFAPGETGPFEAGDEYTAVIQAGIRNIKPQFESGIHITECEYPTMSARIEGVGSNCAYSMDTRIELSETQTGVTVSWHSVVDISGKLAQINDSILVTASEKLTGIFFDHVEQNVRAARA